jgi:hypothetical protein
MPAKFPRNALFRRLKPRPLNVLNMDNAPAEGGATRNTGALADLDEISNDEVATNAAIVPPKIGFPDFNLPLGANETISATEETLLQASASSVERMTWLWFEAVGVMYSTTVSGQVVTFRVRISASDMSGGDYTGAQLVGEVSMTSAGTGTGATWTPLTATLQPEPFLIAPGGTNPHSGGTITSFDGSPIYIALTAVISSGGGSAVVAQTSTVLKATVWGNAAP